MTDGENGRIFNTSADLAHQLAVSLEAFPSVAFADIRFRTVRTRFKASLKHRSYRRCGRTLQLSEEEVRNPRGGDGVPGISNGRKW